MPQIKEYTQQNIAQGAQAYVQGRQANATDMGATVGTGMVSVGSGMGDVANAMYEVKKQEDITDVHVKMAKAQVDLENQFRDLATKTPPGTKDFQQQMGNLTQEYMGKIGEGIQTRQGQSLFANMSSNLSTNMQTKAIAFQASLDGEYAKIQYKDLLSNLGQIAYNDELSSGMAVQQGLAAIDDPDGIFGRVDAATRASFRRSLEGDLKYAAARGFVQRNPGALTGMMDPAQVEQFQPYKNLLTTNVAPGGKLNIGKTTMQWAPDVTVAASARGVNPNILLAQIQKESGGDPMTPDSSAGAMGIAQFMPKTAAQYNIDPMDPKQAIKGQANYMGDLLKMFNGDYTAALAGYNWGQGNVKKAMQTHGSNWLAYAPAETKDYVSTILANSGMVVTDTPMPVMDAGQQPPQRSPIRNSRMDIMNGLTWEQQDHLINEDVRLVNSKLAMQERARVMQERQQKDNQDKVMDTMTKRIFDPENNGGAITDKEIVNDATLTAAQKQHMIGIAVQHARNVDSGTHPTKVRELMQMIHAADDDPTKTYNMQPVDEAYKLGEISTTEYKFLRSEVTDMKDGTSNPFGKQVNSARNTAHDMLTKSVLGSAMPEVAQEAAYRFNMDLAAKIDQYRKENKNPSVLLDPNSREYLLRPDRVMGFMTSASAAMGNQASKVLASAGNDKTAAPGMEVGKTYTVNGKAREYIGGPINVSTSWK